MKKFKMMALCLFFCEMLFSQEEKKESTKNDSTSISIMGFAPYSSESREDLQLDIHTKFLLKRSGKTVFSATLWAGSTMDYQFYVGVGPVFKVTKNLTMSPQVGTFKNTFATSGRAEYVTKETATTLSVMTNFDTLTVYQFGSKLFLTKRFGIGYFAQRNTRNFVEMGPKSFFTWKKKNTVSIGILFGEKYRRSTDPRFPQYGEEKTIENQFVRGFLEFGFSL